MEQTLVDERRWLAHTQTAVTTGVVGRWHIKQGLERWSFCGLDVLTAMESVKVEPADDGGFWHTIKPVRVPREDYDSGPLICRTCWRIHNKATR